MRRIERRGSGTAVLAAALVVAGCSSDESERSLILSRTSNEGGTDVSRPPADPSRPPAFVVDPETTAQLEEWVARPRTLIGDVVEADLSAKPFTGWNSISLPRETGPDGKPIVERIDATDPKTGILSITLVNRSGYRTTIDTLPTVRIGTGLTLIGTDRVVLRFDGIQPEQRPIWASVVATGKARMIQTAPERRLAGETIRLATEVVLAGSRYEMKESEAAR